MNEQPNIILIITDQQRYDTINALGFPYVDTPNLDKLVNEGVSFSNCHVTAPSCAPSRASLFSGYYPHVTGILKNGDTWKHSWVELLADSGYHCVNIGKMHTNPYEAPMGFHERYVVENKDRYLQDRYYFDEWDTALRARGLVKQQRELYRQLDDYKERMGAFEWVIDEDMHPDNFVGNFAQWWIGHYPKTEPLFLEIGFPGPHPPYDPTPEYAEKYLARDIPLPNVTQEERDQLPPPYSKLIKHNTEVDHDSIHHLEHPTEEQLHRLRAYYMANVEMIDKQVGDIMEALDKNGYLDNSIVIFTSDHGDCVGDHGNIQKWMMYDVVTRVPTIFWSSKGFPQNKQVDSLCQWMDIGQTVLELAGASVPESFQTESLVPALTDDEWAGREYVFSEHPPDAHFEGPYMTMIRSQKYKLVHFMGADYGQLFDLEADPEEVHNLWGDTAHQTIKHEMLMAMLDWRTTSTFDTRDVFADHR